MLENSFEFLKLWINPLGVFLGFALILAPLFFAYQWKRCAAACFGFGVLQLLLFSSPWVSEGLTVRLERVYLPIPFPDLKAFRADAIVVLGRAELPVSFPRAYPEFNGSGEIMIHAARLYKAKVAPLVVATGAQADLVHGGLKEGGEMKPLITELGVPVDHVSAEWKSLTTYENAVNTKDVLKGKSRIILVGAAIHLPRATAVFRKLGFDVLPEPVDFTVVDRQPSADRDGAKEGHWFEGTWKAFLPSASHLLQSQIALYEYLGIVTYRVLGWI